MDVAFALLFVSPAPFFCHNCHLLPPAASGCSAQGTCSVGSPAKGRGAHWEKL